MDQYTEELIRHMSGFVTENKLTLFHRVLSERTRYITVVLEDLYQSHNASAVMRTCDCTGIQDVYVVEQNNEYDVNVDIALGSNKWLTIHHYNGGAEISRGLHNRKPDPMGGTHITRAVEALKKKGYRIVATSPHREGTTPETFDLEKGKAALLFGTELNGLTLRALELADEFIRIPMVGFTESYNISVSAAVILSRLRKRLEESTLDWRLGEEEKGPILLNWLRNTIRMAEQIENKFRREYSSTI
ncbi:MAG: RNA methyltransferase [Bacteroidota bacterium]